MTVTARWPIKGLQAISTIVDYIKDDKKTTKEQPTDAKKEVSETVFNRLLGYIGRNQKITEQQQG